MGREQDRVQPDWEVTLSMESAQWELIRTSSSEPPPILLRAGELTTDKALERQRHNKVDIPDVRNPQDEIP